MDSELTAIRDAWKRKTEAKARVMAAVGEAKLAELEHRDADAAIAWGVVATNGFNGGTEGEAEAEARALADAYVESRPDLFRFYEAFSEDDCVRLLEGFRDSGNEEGVWRTQCWLWFRFPKKHIGGRGEAQVRRSLPKRGGLGHGEAGAIQLDLVLDLVAWAKKRLQKCIAGLMLIGAFGLAALFSMSAVTLENAAAQSMIQALENAINDGTAAVIEIRTSGETTLLATLPCSADFGTVSDGNPGGLLTAGTITDDSSADNTGTAATFVLLTQTGGTRILGGSVGTSGADINFDTVSFVAGATVSITSFTITMPESA